MKGVRRGALNLMVQGMQEDRRFYEIKTEKIKLKSGKKHSDQGSINARK